VEEGETSECEAREGKGRQNRVKVGVGGPARANPGGWGVRYVSCGACVHRKYVTVGRTA